MVIEQARRMGTPLPERLANPPQLTPGLEFYYVAFITLSSERQTGFGEGRIPWSKAKQYAETYGCRGEDFERFWLVLSHMDGAYLKYRSDKSKKDMNTGSKGPIGRTQSTPSNSKGRKPLPSRK